MNQAQADSTVLQSDNQSHIITGKERRLLMAFRQALIIALGAIEDYLEMPRTVLPKRKAA